MKYDVFCGKGNNVFIELRESGNSVCVMKLVVGGTVIHRKMLLGRDQSLEWINETLQFPSSILVLKYSEPE